MKKLTLLIGSLVLTGFVFSQTKKINIQAESIEVQYHGTTQPLIDYTEPAGTVNEITKTSKVGYHPKHDWIINQSVNPNALPHGEDPALQKSYAPANLNKGLENSWDAIDDFNVSPADPSVDVGPNHVVHMTNGPSGAYIQIYTKTGTPIGNQVYFDNFMSMPGGLGDPIVLYDERADRWLLSEFAQGSNNMHVAISTTNDPTGTYHTYTFTAPNFPDYPKYSIWEDAYIITTNENTSRVYALNRTDLLAGTASAAQTFSMTNFGTIGFQAAAPVSLNGTTPPPANTPPMIMRMRDDAWTGSTSDALEIWDINIDWANSGNSSLSSNTVLGMNAIPAFDSELCGYTSFSCIDQPGSNTNLDPLREVLMNRIHYRNFGTHESIVCCHVTDVDGNDLAGIRWYELRRTGGSSGSWDVYQEGTYSPDSDSRWMPSIGLSASGNIGLAYNVSSSTTYPSIRYTGRKSCDPLNMMTEPETSIAVGTTNNSSNRYGDYNALGCDPSDGETFFVTAIYNPTNSGVTRIGSFNIDVCAQDPEVSFNSATLDVNEADATVSASSCLDYSVVNIPINIGAAPSQDADITINITGGTATNNVDYVLNNTSFTLQGTTLTGNAELWVYNDAEVEGDETITLDYTLNANGGDAFEGAINQTMTITINDDDVAANLMVNQSTIYSEDFNAGFGAFSTNNPSGDTPFTIGNEAAASSGAVAFPVSNTSDFAWINDDDCNCDQSAVDLIFPSADLTNYSTANLSFLSYYEGKTYQGATETLNLYASVNGAAATLVAPIIVDGAWVTQSYDVSGFTGNNDVVFMVRYGDDAGWLYGAGIDDVLLTGSSAITVQTVTNIGMGDQAHLGPNMTVNFYDATSGNIMMTLENTSTHNYGCVDVEVDRDGTGAEVFNVAATADYLASKTYTVTPTNNNSSGSYNVTTYYNEAEVSGWESVTGNSRNNAEIVKVSGNNSIADVNTGNYGSFNIASSPTILGAFGSDVTFQGSFSTGFSGFGLGIYNPGAPVAPTANFSADVTTVCTGQTVSFTDLSGGTPTSWAWDFGDTQSSSMQNPTHVFTTPGTYSVSLTATNATGSDAQTLTAYITVTNGFTTAQSFEICQGDQVTVGTSTYNSAGTFTDVLTSLAGCDSTVNTTISILMPSASTQNVDICQNSSYQFNGNSYTTAGSYTDVIMNAVGCDSTVTTVISVLPLPTVGMSPSSQVKMCTSDNPLSLVGNPTGGTFTGVGVSNDEFDPSQSGAGTHTVTYSYTDNNNCTNTTTLSIIVDNCSGVNENQLEGVKLFPNPNDGQFVVEGLEIGAEFTIYNEAGQVVFKGQMTSLSTQIAMPVIQSGMYHIESTKNGKRGTMRFIVTN